MPAISAICTRIDTTRSSLVSSTWPHNHPRGHVVWVMTHKPLWALNEPLDDPPPNARDDSGRYEIINQTLATAQRAHPLLSSVPPRALRPLAPVPGAGFRPGDPAPDTAHRRQQRHRAIRRSSRRRRIDAYPRRSRFCNRSQRLRLDATRTDDWSRLARPADRDRGPVAEDLRVGREFRQRRLQGHRALIRNEELGDALPLCAKKKLNFNGMRTARAPPPRAERELASTARLSYHRHIFRDHTHCAV